MKWSDLQIFASVAKTGSFNAAAAQLGVTQPTVSRSIKRLEEEFGITLFNKFQSGANITSYGEHLLDEVMAMQTNSEALKKAVSMINKPFAGDISIQGTPGLLYHWLAGNLHHLSEKHPQLNIVFFGTEVPESPSVRSDFRLTYSLPENSELKVSRIGTLHMTPHASRDYLRANGFPRNIDELRSHRIIDHAVPLQDESHHQYSTFRGKSTVAHRSNDGTIQAKLVSHGHGIGILGVGAHVFYKDVVPLPIPELIASTPIYLSYRPELETSPKARAVMKWIKFVFGRKYFDLFKETITIEELKALAS